MGLYENSSGQHLQKMDVGADHDFEYMHLKFEVKGSGNSLYPHLDWLVEFAEAEKDKNHPVNFYIFAKIGKGCKVVYLVGWISCGKFYKMAKFEPKGTLDKGGLTTQYDRYVTEISNLEPIDKLGTIIEDTENW